MRASPPQRGRTLAQPSFGLPNQTPVNSPLAQGSWTQDDRREGQGQLPPLTGRHNQPGHGLTRPGDMDMQVQMIRSWIAASAVLMMAATTGAIEPPWRRLYSDQEASGPQVIALWSFDGQGAAALEDASGNGHNLTLRGTSRVVSAGKFGGALESFPSNKDNDHPQGALATNAASLTPEGAFAVEAWFKLNPDTKVARAFFVDKKNYYYTSDRPRANRDYCFFITPKGGLWTLHAGLGFGDTSAFFASQPVEIPADEWHHAACTYDGAGTLRFFFDGRSVGGRTEADAGPVVAGQYDLVVGGRVGSIHTGFPGFLDQVRISRGNTPFFTGDLTLSTHGARTVFQRLEPDATVDIQVSNDTGQALPPGTLSVTLGRESTYPVPALAAGAQHTLPVPLQTSLRPGDYSLRGRYAAGGFSTEASMHLSIVPRPLPHVMPVVMWGTGDLDRVSDIGFTHQLRWMGYFDGHVIRSKTPMPGVLNADTKAQVVQGLDEHQRAGIGVILKFAPGSYMARQEAFMKEAGRVDREGTPYERANVCASHPDVPVIGQAVGASVMQVFGHSPAIQAAMIQSEIRDGTAPCFHDYDQRAFETYAGFPIPGEVQRRTGVNWQRLADFPPERIIPETHPLLTYYRWFWTVGDGWNAFHSAIHRGIKSTGRADVWTYHDPAVRVPSIWGSGGEVDVLSQWTYTYPDPIKIGQATDELFAMARGRPGQGVMKMTQMIWKRFQTTTKNTPENQLAAWERELPDAVYYTIAPDHLREAFWSKISRPVRGIMYHGWGSLVLDKNNTGSYVFTHPQTAPVLRELIHEVVRPLGPTLLQVPDAPSDVALLESFSSQMLAGRGSWGWGTNWTADAHLVLQWAGLQPEIVYEETILRDGLDRFRVLVLPSCDVLTESIAERIQAFQDRGGILVADERIPPAILPDILLPSYRRVNRADVDKQALQQRAAALRAELDTVYRLPFASSTPDLVLRRRRFGSTDYLFAVNDRRTFGTYVGQHGRTMEQGLALEGEISLPQDGAVVYDLTQSTLVPTSSTREGVRFPCALAPGSGTVYMVCREPIGSLGLSCPRSVSVGEQFTIQIVVRGRSSQPLDAVVPLRLDITDPEGRQAEFSGWYGAAGGRLSVSLDPAPNDLPGTWRVRVRELASGSESERVFELGN